VAVGDTLTLLFVETPATGFMWQLRYSDLKEHGLLGKIELAQTTFSTDRAGKQQRGAIAIEGYRTI
jgi:predicted secreted protein